MSLPVRHDIDEAYTDTRVRRVFRWQADGDPVDLTGWVGRLRIGEYGDLVVEVADAVTLDADGTVTVDIPPGTLPDPGTYWYVVDLLDPSAEPTRFAHGTLRMLAVFP